MSRKRYSAEQIVNKLRQADVLLSQGQAVSQASKQIGITDQTYYRWRKEYGGLKTDQTRRLKEVVGVKTLFIEPGSPWENDFVESFNGKLRNELLNGNIFYTLKEAKVLIEQWRHHYNTVCPHSSLGYRPPAPEAIAVVEPSSAALQPVQQPKQKVLKLI